MENTDETQADVEWNNDPFLEGCSAILGEQNIVQDGVIFIEDKMTWLNFDNAEDQTSTSDEEFEWNDDSGVVSKDTKHMGKKSNKKNKNVVVEDDDDRSRFSQLSTTMLQPEDALPQISHLALNNDECSSAIAIDVSRKKRNEKKPKQSNQIEDKDTTI